MAKSTVKIYPDGKIEIDNVGFQGPSCEKFTEALLAPLNATIFDSEKKAEYYATELQEENISSL